MFEAWGRIIQRRRWMMLALGLLGVAIAGAWGTGVFRSLQPSGGRSRARRGADAACLIVAG